MIYAKPANVNIDFSGRCDQLAAFFTSAVIFASSAEVNLTSANPAAHILPSSRFAESVRPNVEYREPNLLPA